MGEAGIFLKLEAEIYLFHVGNQMQEIILLVTIEGIFVEEVEG